MSKKHTFYSLFLILLIAFLLFNKSKIESLLRTKESSNAISTTPDIANFGSMANDGEFYNLYSLVNSKLIVLISIGNDCPISQKYSLYLNKLNEKYKKDSVTFLYINSNLQDSRDSINKESTQFNYGIPVLLDQSQLIAKSLGITRTAEAIIIQPNSWKLIYRGAISDRLDYGIDKQLAKNNYLEDAINSYIESGKISTSSIPAKGCLITFQESANIKDQDAIKIIENKCVVCHSTEGQFLPHFVNMKKFKMWKKMSLETIFTGRMPPSGIDHHVSEIKDDIYLTDEEKNLLYNWLLNTEIKDSDEKIVFKKQKPANLVRKTEYLFTLKRKEEHIIKPQGDLEYVYFEPDITVPFDSYVTTIDYHSSNPARLHHVSLLGSPVSLDEIDQIIKKRNYKESSIFHSNEVSSDEELPLYRRRTIAIVTKELGWPPTRLQIWAAGKKQPFKIGDHLYKFFKKDQHLILEAHFMGSGKEEKEISTIDFYGYKNAPQNYYSLKSQSNVVENFTVPANTNYFKITSKAKIFSKNVKLIGVNFHMHVRGKSAKVYLKNNLTKQSKLIYSIPNYFYGWHTGVFSFFKKPISIKANEYSVYAECVYDNSSGNPYNPNSNIDVKWGQRHDTTEMCMNHMMYIEE